MKLLTILLVALLLVLSVRAQSSNDGDDDSTVGTGPQRGRGPSAESGDDGRPTSRQATRTASGTASPSSTGGVSSSFNGTSISAPTGSALSKTNPHQCGCFQQLITIGIGSSSWSGLVGALLDM
ncbi:hypothetical protein K493DRAFT_304192 [Basidiobolus meristosporus CBS 931.73]|uniref:Uncharacterized protein n=1 Tax=Basidiobolus meristosporus CBS 931.73 TaxID=1314790 RepID=A0A1Y1Y036_9FUNG|nr:hypothetical protein K493DRAFT_304192 [Basidiobolus meristosporus CBS 931.73]|eukprot:ORX91265.1 hypothetical protein K493DRAFT_304192 [Basidiobolus meristosporus CBS 931.73]